MRFNIHAGHNDKVPGASGYLSETKENRKVKDFVVAKLKSLGHEVYDCSDEVATTQTKNLVNIVNKCNKHSVDVDVSIHFNVSNGLGHGCEVYYYSNQGKVYASRVVNAISKLGFKNRNAKKNTTLYVLRKTKSPAILIECCFLDNKKDINLYDPKQMADAIVEGLVGKTFSLTKGIYEVTASALKVRTGPGIDYQAKKKRELSQDGQKHANVNGALLKGTRVSVYEWKNGWAQIPSGWVCGNYLKKV